MTFFILILFHTVSKMGMYGLLYILTYSLQVYFKKAEHVALQIIQISFSSNGDSHSHAKFVIPATEICCMEIRL